MKILLIGQKGQLAKELIRKLQPIGEIISVDRLQFDIGNKNQVTETVKVVSPDLVINASAYNDVDGAEENRELAMTVNADGPGWLAKVCKTISVPLIHYSTNFVFDGTKGLPYVETDIPNPVNVYGLSKLRGEEAIQSETNSFMIFRLAWLYSAHGNNFVTKFIQWAKQKETIHIVDDQFGSPTWARFVAECTGKILEQVIIDSCVSSGFEESIKKFSGIYHLTSDGCASKFEWACYIKESGVLGKLATNVTVLECGSSHFPDLAVRPKNVSLGNEKSKNAFAIENKNWKEYFDLFAESYHWNSQRSNSMLIED